MLIRAKNSSLGGYFSVELELFDIKMRYSILYFCVVFLTSMVLSCEWVCIDEKNKNKPKSANDVQIRYTNHIITVPTVIETTRLPKSKIKKKKSNIDPLLNISLRGPQIIEVFPESSVREPKVALKQSTQMDCRDRKFNEMIAATRKNASCIPREVLVDVVSQEGKVLPSKILTKMCGGFCYSRVKSCVATKTKNVTISVRIETAKGIKCSTISIPEDKKCRCGCSEPESNSCLPTQIYDKSSCTCVCNKFDEYACSRKSATNPLYTWNRDSCKCVCKQRKMCTTGTVWDENLCRCKLKSTYN